jgi:hypothetical protein
VADIRSILLRILANADDAEKTLGEVSGEIDKFGKKRATAQLRVDAAQAKRDLAEVRAELAAIPQRETIRLRVEGEQAKLQTLMQRLRALQATQSAGGLTDSQSLGVTRQIGVVAGQIDQSRSRLEALGAEFERVGVKGETAFTRIAGGLQRARTGLVGLVEKIPLIGGLAGGLANGVNTVLEKLVTLLPQGIQGFAGMVSAGLGLLAVGPILLLIAGAVAALVVSLGEALIGVIALGVAFLAALAPIGLLLAAVVIKLKDAYTAQQNLKQATTAYANAVASQKQAVQNLAQAERNESQQRLQALQAEKDAILAIRDAENQAADARLGVRSATLGIAQAKLALAQFKQQLAGFGLSPADLEKRAQNVSVSGNFGQTQAGANQTAWQSMLLQYKALVLGVAQAEQQRKDATQAVADATNNLSKAQQQEQQFAKFGLQGYQGYYDAVQQVQQAVAALATANRQLSLSAYNLRHDTKQLAASDGVIGIFDKFKKTLNELFGPAVKATFKGLAEAFTILGRGLKPLEPAFTALGKAVGAGLVSFARAITSPTGIKEFGSFIRETARFVPALVKFFEGVGAILLGVANAALPHLTGGLGALGDKFKEVAKHPQDIATFIDKCIQQTKDWLHWIGLVLTAVGKIANFFTGTLIPTIKGIGPVIQEFLVTPIGWALDKVAKLWGIFQSIHAAEARGAAIAAANAAPEGKLLQRLVARKDIGSIQGLLSSQEAALSKGGLSTAELMLELKQVKAELLALQKLGVKLPLGESINGILRNLAAQSALGGNVVLPKLAAGGVTVNPTVAMIGESGHEAVIPLSGNVFSKFGDQIARYLIPDLALLMRVHQPTFAYNAPTGGDTHVHMHLNQGDTISSPEHFSTVVMHRVRSLGGGRR